MSQMKVLFISSFNGVSPANYLLDALRQQASEIITISDVPNSEADVFTRGAFDVTKYLEESDFFPDLILFVEGGEMNILPVNYKNLGIPAIWWGIDTHNDYQKHLRVSRLFDHSFIAQKSFVHKLQKDGIPSVSWLPLAFPNQSAGEYRGQKKLDIAYVGSTNWSKYPERGMYLSSIRSEFPRNYIGKASPLEMFKIYSNSKLVFNFSPMNDLNMRVFEALGSGAVLLTNPIIENGIEDLFESGKDYLEYSSKDELHYKINTILKDEIKLKEIASSGKHKVLSLHTYRARAQEISEFTSQIQPNLKYSQLDVAAALLSFGFLPEAIRFIAQTLNEESLGRRNRLILITLLPALGIIGGFTRVMDSILRGTRRKKW